MREVPPVELAGQVAALGPGTTVVEASGRAARVAIASGATRELIGHRQVVAASVQPRPSARHDTCHMETVPGGWVFLAPTGADRAVLQAMSTDASTPPDDVLIRLLAGIELIDTQITEIRGPAVEFPAGPQRCAPSAGGSSGRSWIAIGDAAIALDPVAGGGVGHSLRGALLTAAVLHVGRADAVEHYRSRLDEAFGTHLRRCLAYYAGFDGPGAANGRRWNARHGSWGTRPNRCGTGYPGAGWCRYHGKPEQLSAVGGAVRGTLAGPADEPRDRVGRSGWMGVQERGMNPARDEPLRFTTSPAPRRGRTGALLA